MNNSFINTAKYFLANASGDGVLSNALKTTAAKQINQSTINQVKEMIADNKKLMIEIIGRDGVHFFNKQQYIPMQLQIDVKKITKIDYAECRMIVDGRDILIFMHKTDYEKLIEDGFFVRDGKSEDSSGCINTTKVFEEKKFSY